MLHQQKNTPAEKKQRVIALAGNPNVGKSTLFNQLTGMHQHTGNWPGKTVSGARGVVEHKNNTYLFVDLPGTYSLFAHSAEEEVARDFICFGQPDAVLLVCDATCLARNLNLVLQTLEITSKVVVCVNLLDEAKRKHIKLDLPLLSDILGVPVVGCTAKDKRTLPPLLTKLEEVMASPPKNTYKVDYPPIIEQSLGEIASCLPDMEHRFVSKRWLCLRLLEGDTDLLRTTECHLGQHLLKEKKLTNTLMSVKSRLSPKELQDSIPSTLMQKAEHIAKKAETEKGNHRFDRQMDQLLTGRKTAFPMMILFLLLIFWITISGANIISAVLSNWLFRLGDLLTTALNFLGSPHWLTSAVTEGMFRVLSWVVAVMLPPMLIFFPLFTLLEDVGYLPRIAYNVDRPFGCCGACGKQALTMCMGFGCNAVGVMGCRIIDSKRERLLAQLTNCFVPCNGRFPLLITLLSLFFVGTKSNGFMSALLLTAVILLSVAMTLLVTKLLSATWLKGVPSSFTLEMPPYRKPQLLQVLVRSVLDRTLFVLGRAVVVALPAGLVLWVLANVRVSGVTLLTYSATWLDPFAKLLGMDGMILLAFILAFPANEIMLPILLMGYLAEGSLVEPGQADALRNILVSNGWTTQTALSVILFSLFHFPCSTTLLTLKKETGSFKKTVIAFLLPTAVGIICCLLVNGVVHLLS